MPTRPPKPHQSSDLSQHMHAGGPSSLCNISSFKSFQRQHPCSVCFPEASQISRIMEMLQLQLRTAECKHRLTLFSHPLVLQPVAEAHRWYYILEMGFYVSLLLCVSVDVKRKVSLGHTHTHTQTHSHILLVFRWFPVHFLSFLRLRDLNF